MTRAQAELLVGALMGAWPWASWPDVAVASYREELERLGDYATAEKVVVGARRAYDRPPSIHRLLDDYDLLRRRAAEENADSRGLPEPDQRGIHRETVAWLEGYLGRSFQHLLKDLNDAA